MGFKDENIIILINSDATKSNIKSQLNNLVNLSQNNHTQVSKYKITLFLHHNFLN